MTIADIVVLVLKGSVVLFIFSIALEARAEQTVYLFRRPAKLATSLLAMNGVMPLFAVAVVALFPGLHPVVKVSLAALSVSPVPPFLPSRIVKQGGSEAYIIGLLAAAALLSIVLVPAIIGLMGLVFDVDAHADIGKIGLIVTITVLAPLAAGVAIRQFLPHVADWAARPVALLATVLLAATGLAGIVALWPLIAVLIGGGTVLAFLAFVLVGVVVGHTLGGPEPEDRTVLAFATACRHPGVALGVVTANFADAKLGTASVVLYLLVSIVGTIPYTMWRKRHDPHLPVPAE
jgi:BASS family bile acid:Na+ symporter